MAAALGTVIGQVTDAPNKSTTHIVYEFVKNLVYWSNDDSVLYTLIQTVYENVAVIAISLCLCFALLDLLRSSMRSGSNGLTYEIVIVPLLKFAACYIVIKNGNVIINAVLEGSNWFATTMDTAIQSVTATGEAPDSLKKVNGMLATVMLMGLPVLISLICQVVACVLIAMQIVTIKVEISLRAMFMPLAVSSIAQDGISSSGMRYIKKFLGNIFLLGGILVVVKVVSFIGVSMASSNLFAGEDAGYQILAGIFSAIFNSALVPFASVSAIATLKSTINDAMA